ncbi:glucosidase [Domibacillus enclensis]|uniref:Alpha-galactosidase n=1 Tax=Domibacillus enclensis TaxID=1017273 RepID=A0A1N6Z916_9BACI|nr:glucosidase [Domibacillus enclensis]OXS76629.1 alpha-glucosidase/alpha-galactosidase [Domibacillus enclensis]SIR23350.1 alpha-galactosidase [Domibacillus enclensis]
MKKRIENVKIAYIGGGSQGWAKRLMNDLALEARISGTVALYDIHPEAARQNAKIGNLLSEREEAVGKWTYEATGDIQEALTDADFVIISILPGSFQEMASDVHVPEKYGIYQSVGDTVGPGGMIRALRTIPIYKKIAESIKQYSPEAWVINYTNPMTLCTRTLYEVFPAIKAFGCCHEVFDVQHLLADMVEEATGEKVERRQDIHVNVIGINHFTWIDRASYQNIDLLPLYKQFALKYAETGFEKEPGSWERSVFSSANRVKFDLFNRYGLIAAAGDRHLAEFMPPVYLESPEKVTEWKFHLTPVDFRINDQQSKMERTQKAAAGEEHFELAPSGEEGVAIIAALLGLEELVTNVNVPNNGQIANLPKGAVVETNAVLRFNSVQPVLAGSLPADVHGLVSRHVANQETILRAALDENRQLALNAFINDPLVEPIGLKQAEKLFNEMMDNTKEWIGGGFSHDQNAYASS